MQPRPSCRKTRVGPGGAPSGIRRSAARRWPPAWRRRDSRRTGCTPAFSSTGAPERLGRSWGPGNRVFRGASPPADACQGAGVGGQSWANRKGRAETGRDGGHARVARAAAQTGTAHPGRRRGRARCLQRQGAELSRPARRKARAARELVRHRSSHLPCGAVPSLCHRAQDERLCRGDREGRPGEGRGFRDTIRGCWSTSARPTPSVSRPFAAASWATPRRSS